MKLNKLWTIIITEISYALAGFLILAGSLEWRFPYIISAYINLNYLLLLWVLLGIALAIGRQPVSDGKE